MMLSYALVDKENTMKKSHKKPEETEVVKREKALVVQQWGPDSGIDLHFYKQIVFNPIARIATFDNGAQLLLGNDEVRDILITNRDMKANGELFDDLTFLMAGIQDIDVSPWLADLKKASSIDTLISFNFMVGKEAGLMKEIPNAGQNDRPRHIRHPISENASKGVDIEGHYDQYLKLFPQWFEEIDQCLQRGETILIHCNQGEHRSATVLVSYLLSKGYFTSFEDAHGMVSRFREIKACTLEKHRAATTPTAESQFMIAAANHFTVNPSDGAEGAVEASRVVLAPEVPPEKIKDPKKNVFFRFITWLRNIVIGGVQWLFGLKPSSSLSSGSQKVRDADSVRGGRSEASETPPTSVDRVTHTGPLKPL